ncbi:hypothetical protein ACOSQ2_027895 [Xanthoceras sorbifolium]
MDDPTTIMKRLLAECNTPSTVEEIGFLASSVEDYEKCFVLICIEIVGCNYFVYYFFFFEKLKGLCVLCLEMKTHKYQLLLDSGLPGGWCSGAVQTSIKQEKKLNKVVPK